MYDIVIKNGTIIDGTRKKAYVADIGIKDDKIVEIGKINQEENLINAEGKYITPGFIDTHSHADCSVFLYPDCQSYVKQGITTFIGGQCGDSNAPINNYWMRKYWEFDLWDDIDPFVYNPRTIRPVKDVLPVIEKRTGYKIGWKTFKEYIDVVEKQGIACNMITLAGHSQIRADVMGLDEMRKPTAEEMEKMKEHLTEAMESGAWGMSTGRDYPPSAYAEKDEIVELVNHIKQFNGYYFTHWKSTGVRIGTPTAPNKLAGIIEALEIALETGAKTEISHISAGFDIYPENPDMDTYAAKVTCDVIDEYIKKGADVAYDIIVGSSGGIRTIPYLVSYFMPWLKQSGTLEQFVKNLKAYDYRDRLVTLIRNGEWYAINPKSRPSWDKKIYIIASTNESYVGKNIRQIAEEKQVDSVELLIDLMIEDPRIRTKSAAKSDAEIRGMLKHERASVCTDTYAFDLKGLYGNDTEIPEILPHPHTYCAYPKYILDYGMDTLEETIWKITGFPAGFMGIKGRGTVEIGNYADLVILDLKNLKSNENYIEPRVYPEGIDYVFINGKAVVNNSELTGARPGRVLKNEDKR